MRYCKTFKSFNQFVDFMNNNNLQFQKNVIELKLQNGLYTLVYEI